MSDNQANTDPMSVTHLAGLIHDLGYKAKIMDTEDRAYIASAASGTKFVVIPFASGSLQFSLTFKNDLGFTPVDANEFNRKNRFAKVYIGFSEQDNEIVLEADLTGPPNRPEDWLEASFDRWEHLIGSLKDTLEHFTEQVSQPALEEIPT